MTYRRFLTRYSTAGAATVATVATLQPEAAQSVANVASVAAVVRLTPLRESVANVATVAGRGWRSSWDADDWQAAFDERAAILEFDEGLSREDAERMAEAEIAARRRVLH